MITDSRPRTRQEWERLLRDLRVRPSRAMGQNFLVEPGVVDRILDIAEVSETDSVLEIGPGLGILTSALEERAAMTVAVELDSELTDYLRSKYRAEERVRIVEQDARYVDVEALGLLPTYKVVANLPYSTATVILRRLLEQSTPPASLTVMVQREVGDRMTAEPPAMSLLALATQLYSQARVAFVVGPEAFSPPPRVDSAVVRLDPHPSLPLPSDDRQSLFELATMAFQAKRKTLANSLAAGLSLPKSAVAYELTRIDIDPMRRPQTLTVAEWCRLAQSSLGERAA